MLFHANTHFTYIKLIRKTCLVVNIQRRKLKNEIVKSNETEIMHKIIFKKYCCCCSRIGRDLYSLKCVFIT